MALSMVSFAFFTGVEAARSREMTVVPVTSIRNTAISRRMVIFAPISVKKYSSG